MLSADLATFVESGVSMFVGSRDARLVPAATRAVGLRVEPGGAEVTVYLPVATAARSIENLRDNGRLALCCSRVLDNRAIQLKGRVVGIHEGEASDQDVVERYNAAFTEALAIVGVPPRLTRRIARWPCHAIRFAVESVFVQTPGPGAGAPLGEPAHREPRR